MTYKLQKRKNPTRETDVTYGTFNTFVSPLWQLLFFQGLEIVFRVGIAILQLAETELLKCDADGMLQVKT